MATDHIFSGLKVVDLASFIAGPAATTVLSDFGADVIKVEPPGIGDPYRYFYRTPPNPSLKDNYTWQLTNRNKRSLAVDLKNPQSAEVLARLVKWADVFVTNFPPRVRKGLKVNYEDLFPFNPRLIYAALTGYGEEGPEADKPGFDITAYWARSGLMEFTRDPGAPPAIPVPGIGDHAAAISLYAGIVTGLYRRERTGKGCNVSASLIAEGAWATAAWLQAALDGAKFALNDRSKPENPLAGGTYQSSDSRWLLLAFVESDKNWPVFTKAMGRDDLTADARFADSKSRTANAEALVAELDRTFGTQPLAYWKKTLDGARLPYGVAQIPEEIVKDPQLLANDIIVPIANGSATPHYTVNSPVTIKQAPKVPPRVAPELGEHTDQVLQEIGFDSGQIDGLRASGAIPAAKERTSNAGRASGGNAAAGRLFVLEASGNCVLSMNADGSDRNTIVSNCQLPDGIAVDVEAGHIYWTNMGIPNVNDGSIERADIDGRNRTIIVPQGGTFTPKQLQLDKKNGKLYWCDREGMRVMRSNLDGSKIEILVETGHGDADRRDQTKWCVGIAVDADHEQIYWTQKGPDNGGQGRIFRTHCEIPKGESAASRSDIEVLFEDLPEPIDLGLDPIHRVLYWTDRGDPPNGNTVNRSPVDAGPERQRAPEIVLTHLMEGIGIALDVPGERMFLTDLGGSIYCARFDGSEKRVFLQAQGNLTGIAYVEIFSKEN
jgi:crotonobetainyl-CoA:carnitine CoA-transferase CaiB-like acyl-CoA transferase